MSTVHLDETVSGITYAVCILTPSTSKETQKHCKSLKRVLRYLNNTADLRIMLGEQPEIKELQLFVFVDSYLGRDATYRRSTTG